MAFGHGAHDRRFGQFKKTTVLSRLCHSLQPKQHVYGLILELAHQRRKRDGLCVGMQVWVFDEHGMDQVGEKDQLSQAASDKKGAGSIFSCTAKRILAIAIVFKILFASVIKLNPSFVSSTVLVVLLNNFTPSSLSKELI